MQLEGEAQKRADLQRMWTMATGLLVLSGVVFVVARVLEERHPWLGGVRATAEAAMVGGIADWFAVTALFRHPLGIPIPHTAIVPRRKSMIGRSLGRFVEENFLSRPVLVGRLRSMDVVGQLAGWLQREENSQRLASTAADGLSALVRSVDEAQALDVIERAMERRVEAVELTPLAGNALAMLVAGERHHLLVDGAISLAWRLLEENHPLLRRAVEEQTPWWVPAAVDDTIYRKIVLSVGQALEEARLDPAHPVRERFREMLARAVEELRTSAELRERGEALKEELARELASRSVAADVWSALRASLLRQLEDPGSGARRAVAQGIQQLGARLSGDDELRSTVERWVEEGVAGAAERHGHELASLIAHTVEAWDAGEAARKIELQVGRDLQFIRINGTLVGGLVGLLLYLFGSLL